MRILVTGGTGFLGRSLLPMLAEHEVFALSRGSHKTGNWPEGINWIETDPDNGLDVASLPAKMDGIIHLAQSHRYREFPDGAQDMFAINVELPATLLRWADKAGVSRFVGASTGSVYEPFSGPMVETKALSPTGYYGASKLAAETLALAYRDRFAVAQMRVFFLYGPGQQGMMMASIINNVAQGNTLSLPRNSDGLVFVPTYVEDTARVFKQACEESWSGLWNVASPHKVSLRYVMETTGRLAGRSPVIEETDAPAPTPIVPNLDKLRDKIKLDDFVSIEKGIEKTLAFS